MGLLEVQIVTTVYEQCEKCHGLYDKKDLEYLDNHYICNNCLVKRQERIEKRQQKNQKKVK